MNSPTCGTCGSYAGQCTCETVTHPPPPSPQPTKIQKTCSHAIYLAILFVFTFISTLPTQYTWRPIASPLTAQKFKCTQKKENRVKLKFPM